MRPLLMGVETEYAVTGFHVDGAAPAETLLDYFLQTARRRLPHVPEERSSIGVFLGNGGRFYIDAGSHPEFATPECTEPRELLTYVRAGERILLELAREVARNISYIDEIGVFRCNVDYSAKTTWGCHESYLHRTDPQVLPKLLIPHLVSRVIYSGAGGFNVRSAGVEFTLSPRVSMLEHTISETSTAARGIFHTKDETLGTAGQHRLHVLCGESLCSDLGVLLKIGTTALIVAAIDEGMFTAEGLELQAPLEAMRAIATDPFLRTCVRLRRGEPVTAIELQRRCLAQVESCRAAGRLPHWADEICVLWTDALDQLERNPAWAAGRLDWGIKRALCERWVGGSDLWRALDISTSRWKRVRRLLDSALSRSAEPPPRSLAELMLCLHSPLPGPAARIGRYLHDKRKEWAWLRNFLELREQLFEIDVRFGQLGERGIYEHLARDQRRFARLATDEAIERATREPPAIGRAHLRGKLVQQLHAAGTAATHWCGWTGVWNLNSGASVDMRDPFTTEVKWRKASAVITE